MTCYIHTSLHIDDEWIMKIKQEIEDRLKHIQLQISLPDMTYAYISMYKVVENELQWILDD